MALPKLNVPKYKMKLPSTGQVVNYRPFLVKEEKLLLLATETGEQSDLVTAIKDIITNCTDLTTVDDLATFDIEYLFLQIRGKSVGESVELSLTCPDDNETQVPVKIPLADIKILKNKKHKTEVRLSDEIVMEMQYPSMATFVEMNFIGDDDSFGADQVFEMAADCVKTITDPEQVYDCTDMPKTEIVEFFENLSSKQFMLVQEFFETMPKLSHTVKITNPNTGVESDVVLEGLASFFA